MLLHVGAGYVSSSVARYNEMTNFAAKLLAYFPASCLPFVDICMSFGMAHAL